MKMSKDKKLNDEEIYFGLLAMIAEVDAVNEIDVTHVRDIRTALDRLEVSIKYRMLDVEATRREREYWKDKAENNGKEK